jgi:thiamine biosynthesis lipoprotein
MTLVADFTPATLIPGSVKTRSALLISFLFLFTVVSGCSREEARDARYFSGSTMGTTYNITLVAEAGQRFDFDESELQTAIDAEFVRINQHMSTYISDSELMRLNRAEVGKWHAISRPMHDVLLISQSISERSDGAFDITVGPLVNLWGFGPERATDKVPDAQAIEQLKAEIGYQFLELDGLQIRKSRPLFLDLSAVAKGYGVDWVAEFLEVRGFGNYLVEVGGDLRVSGLNSRGAPWRIAIEQPSQLQRSARMTIAFTDMSLATSGDYRNYFEVDGRRYSHTIDPTTGYPIAHNLVSVTVLAPTAAEADAWATAINVLGPEAGIALAELEQLAVYMILKEEGGYSDRHSSAFSAFQ